MTQDLIATDRWARARQGVHAVADVVAFLLESACVGNGVFWFITWGMLSFDGEIAAREYGRFWTHYAKAGAAARHPVELFLLAAFLGITVLVAIVRAPKARPAWTPWPFALRGERPALGPTADEAAS